MMETMYLAGPVGQSIRHKVEQRKRRCKKFTGAIGLMYALGLLPDLFIYRELQDAMTQFETLKYKFLLLILSRMLYVLLNISFITPHSSLIHWVFHWLE